MTIIRELDSKTQSGPAEWFSGEVWIQTVLTEGESASQRAAWVSFAAGARTAWHTHPRGQMISVVSGVCEVQREGGEVQRVGAGDVVWFAPNEKHWHGAAEGHPMVHLAVQEANEQGEVVVWMEHVKR